MIAAIRNATPDDWTACLLCAAIIVAMVLL